jgi:chromosome segregation ATPase
MILHRIELTHVGPFRETVNLGPFAPGLNVLSAPNETGKSTAMIAAARALFDKHTTKGEELKGLQPVGTELAPRVAVEFETAAGRFRIEKSFLQSPRSLLKQWRDGSWQLMAEADAADQRVQSLLNSTFPGRGATNASHWGFLGFLWARQGEPVEWPKLDDNDVGQQIRHRLARVEIDPVIEQLRDRLGRTADAAITSTGQAKAGGPLRQAEDELAAIQTELAALRQTRDDLEAKHKRYNDATAEVGRLEKEEIDLTRQAGELSQLAQAVELLRGELEAREGEFATAKERLQLVMNDVTALAERDADLREAQDATAKADKAVLEAEDVVSGIRRQVDERQLRRPELETQITKQREKRQRTQSLLKLRQTRSEADALGKLFGKVQEAAALLAGLQEKKSKLPAITPAKVRKLEELAETVRDGKAQLQALGLTVELTPGTNATVDLSESGATQRELLSKGETRILHRPQSLDLKLSGWGRVVVRSGSKEAQELTKDLAAHEESLREALLDAQVASVDAARDVVASRKDLDTQIKAADGTLTDRLGDYETSAELNDALTVANGRAAVLEQTLQVGAEEQVLSITELEAAESRESSDVKAAEAALKSFDKELSHLRERERGVVELHQRAQQEAAHRQTRQRTLETQITDLRNRYPAGIDGAKSQAQTAFYETESRLNGTRAKLPPDFEKLPDRNKRAAASLQQVTNELRTKRTEQSEAKGSLETLGGQGIYSRETELIERQAEVGQRHRATQTLAWAARIAHDLIEYRKQAATKAVLAPLEQRLSAAFAELTGTPNRRVFLDETLRIVGVGRNREETHAFELLSQGAREQLLLCLRIAVAQELAVTEPQVLILDDVLVNTDPVRQERVLETLAAVASRLQVVILTCNPDRYRGVGNSLALG